MANTTRDRVSSAGRGVANTVRENPVPVALIAAGIGWLLMNKRRDQVHYLPEPDHSHSYDETMMIGSDDEHHGLGHDIGDGVQQATEKATAKARDAAGRVASNVKNVAGRVASGAKNVAGSVASGAKNAAHNVAVQTRTQATNVGHKYDESPLALGAVAVAVGVAVGLSLPITRQEQDLMGDKRDELFGKAREAFADTKDKVKRTAQAVVPEVKSAITSAARNEGLVGKSDRAIERLND